MTVAVIAQHSGTKPVRLISRVLEISHSGYYG